MAQWRNLEELSKINKPVADRIDVIYCNQSFVFKIRTLCADFIENDNWVDLTTTDGSAQENLRALIESLEEMGQNGNLKHRLSLKHDIKALQAMSEEDAYQFVQEMKHCIKQEQQLIQSLSSQTDDRRDTQNMATENMHITAEMNDIEAALVVLAQRLSLLEIEQENFNVEHSHLLEKLDPGDKQQALNAADRRKVEEQKTALITSLYQNRQMVAELLEELDGPLNILLDHVWADIDTWKKQQLLQITGLAKPPEGIMLIFDMMCERAGRLLCTALRLTENILNIYEKLVFQGDTLVGRVIAVVERLNCRLQRHVQKMFIVDRPPPQVIKVVNTKSGVFSMSVCLLGACSLGLDTNPCIKVCADLYREKDFIRLLSGYQMSGMCQVTNGKDKTMEFSVKPHSHVKSLTANFPKVCLEKVQRSERSRDEFVTDNKYIMVFCTDIMLHNKQVKLMTYSLPIILTSHVLQDCTARATLIWNAAFPLEDGRAFDEEKEVTWNKVAEVLDALFYVSTERHLSQEQLNYLASIVFKMRDMNINFSEMKISRNKLLKDHLHKSKQKEKENPSRNFSFWKWFYANMNLLKDRLKPEWKDGIIYGFVSKDMAKRLLSDQQKGTFLLRFSESSIEASMRADICGCITVAVITSNPQTGELDVFHVKDHLATKDIHNTSLTQILDSFVVDSEFEGQSRLLRFLWPGRPFEEVFKNYLPEIEDDGGPYKRGRVTISIILGSNDSRMRHGSQVMSPQSVMSDMDDLTIASSPGSVSSMNLPDVTVSSPTPSYSCNISSDEAFVPRRVQGSLTDIEFDITTLLNCDDGDAMLPEDFQLDNIIPS